MAPKTTSDKAIKHVNFRVGQEDYESLRVAAFDSRMTIAAFCQAASLEKARSCVAKSKSKK